MEDDGCARVSMTGELDILHADWLDSELQRLGPRHELVIDVRRLDFVDSSGLLALVRAHRRLEQAGGRLRIVAGRGRVRRLLELAGLDGHLHVEDADL